MGADMARQQSKNPKGEIAAFAIENVPPTKWLPPQLRAKGYDGPPAKKGKIAGSLDDISGPEMIPTDYAKRKPVKPKAGAGKAKKKVAPKKTAKKKKR